MERPMKLFAIAALAAALFGEDPYVGAAPHDGDTVTVRLRISDTGVMYRFEPGRVLHIDAPERAVAGRWPDQPGALEARGALARLLEMAEAPTAIIRARDRYGRILLDISPPHIQRSMVEQGWAWATDKTYRAEMLTAQSARRGLWAEACIIKPKDWRRGKRCAAQKYQAR
jgi:endonuclease YncB( thermonuclease family)